jgi:hypothetical protein
MNALISRQNLGFPDRFSAFPDRIPTVATKTVEISEAKVLPLHPVYILFPDSFLKIEIK